MLYARVSLVTAVMTVIVMTAAVVAAGVTALAVLVVVVVAANVGIIRQNAADECVYRRVSLAAYAAVELDTCLGKCLLSAAADAAADECVYRRVSLAAYAAVELDTCLGKCLLSAAADAAADEGVNAALHQEARKCAVTAAVGVNDLLADYLAVCNLVDLKLLGVPEMLKDFAVVICAL